MTVTYTIGDTRDVIATIPDGSVSLIATSPPFIQLRSYLPADHPDKHAEIGSEPDPATFIDTMLELTAEWGRVLAPWGSIAIELGDTFAGGGGDNHLYEGSNKAGGFNGSAAQGALPGRKRTPTGWPRAKCLALVPQAYALSLAYGRNVLTGQPSPAGQWLVRNVITWHRPNPAVGALGDKYRPSTSQIVVATRSAKRWFDLTAVRGEPSPNTHARTAVGVVARATTGKTAEKDGNFHTLDTLHLTAGAPPLDAWFDEYDGTTDTWTLTTQPSSIKAKVVERVPCGPDDGGERTTSPGCPVHGDLSAPAPTAPGGEPPSDPSTHHTPHTDARHDPERDPAGSHDASTSTRSGQPTASGRNTSSSRTDPAPSTSPPDTPSARTAADTARTSMSPESFGDHPDTSASSSGEACHPADVPETAPRSDHTQGQESACSCTFHIEKHSVHSHYAMWPAKLAERLILSMCPAEVCTSCGEPRRRVEKVDGLRGCDILGAGNDRGTGLSGGRPPMPDITRTTLGWTDCGCQPTWIDLLTDIQCTQSRMCFAIVHELGCPLRPLSPPSSTMIAEGAGEAPAGRTPAAPSLLGARPGPSARFRPGVVLDPFAGTGTTLAVADLHGRDAIGIDIDARNPQLYEQRRAECARNLFDSPMPDTNQLDLFGGVA